MKAQLRAMRESLEILGSPISVYKLQNDDQYWSALLKLVRNARELVALEVEAQNLVDRTFNEAGEEWLGQRKKRND